MPEAFEHFPEIVALGRDRIQQLCDEWRRGPEAKEFGIADIAVAPDGLNLMPTFEVPASSYDKGDELFFPFDRVSRHIIEYGCNSSEREVLNNRLRHLRQKVGVGLFQRYRVNLHAYTMALKCPACSHLIHSQYRIFKGQEFKMTFIEPLTCPRCSKAFTITDRDFFPVFDPGYNEATEL